MLTRLRGPTLARSLREPRGPRLASSNRSRSRSSRAADLKCNHLYWPMHAATAKAAVDLAAVMRMASVALGLRNNAQYTSGLSWILERMTTMAAIQPTLTLMASISQPQPPVGSRRSLGPRVTGQGLVYWGIVRLHGRRYS